jgi:hypothetical protein
MTILICSCQGRKTIIKKFFSNYNHIQVIQTLHFVFELTSYIYQKIFPNIYKCTVHYLLLNVIPDENLVSFWINYILYILFIFLMNLLKFPER